VKSSCWCPLTLRLVPGVAREEVSQAGGVGEALQHGVEEARVAHVAQPRALHTHTTTQRHSLKLRTPLLEVPGWPSSCGLSLGRQLASFLPSPRAPRALFWQGCSPLCSKTWT